MARRNGRTGQSMPEANEIDDFHSNQEKVLLEQAGEYGREAEEQEEDDEVLAVEEDEEDEENEEDESGLEDASGLEEGEEEDDGEVGWGRKSNYYGGDELEDAEAAKQMTEEAIRQQRKNLQELGMDDYVDEDMMEEWDQKAEEFDTETKKTQMIINDSSTDLDKLETHEKLELLTESFPEFLPLLKEMTLLQPVLARFDDVENEVVNVKKVALTAYLGSIASYFSIFVDQVKSGEPFGSMKEHPVMEMILTTRQVWKDADGLEQGVLSNKNSEVTGEVSDNEPELSQDMSDSEMSESHDEFVDAEEPEVASLESGEDEVEESDDDDMNIDITTKRAIKNKHNQKVDDYLEADTPDDVDNQDKQKRKKSLRFYTSKIDQAQAKNNYKLNGDEDLPYRERLFEKRQRLQEEARKRGLGEGQHLGEDLDDQDMNSDDERLVNDINEGDDDYYETLKQGKQHQKAARKQAHKEATKLAKEGKLAEGQELVGEDGKRALNYQILKNKGLTSKKKKDLRNARVKKRKKYDQAKKKLKSVRPVYESNSGPYEGEKTGIKKGLSKSVKLV